MIGEEVIFTDNVSKALDSCLKSAAADKVCLLVDNNTRKYCLPLIEASVSDSVKIIEIPSGEEYKTIDTLIGVWAEMSDAGMSRRSLLICLGGGVVCDLGGFAAATYMRGIRRINIPTTLLADVDASTGGKTAIDFRSVKNEIGVFSEAYQVLISPEFLTTLPEHEFMSGYGEMIKHALLDSDVALDRVKEMIPLTAGHNMLDVLTQSVNFKASVVASDPLDNGLRHVLNLGHTAGHAFESLGVAKGYELAHGVAVAYGLCIALILSRMLCGFPAEKMYDTIRHIRNVFGVMPLACDDYPELLRLMRKDKKNEGDIIHFVLLHDVGKPEIGVAVSESEIESALDIYRDLCE